MEENMEIIFINNGKAKKRDKGKVKGSEKESKAQNENAPRPPLLDRYLYLSLTKETVSMQPEQKPFHETTRERMNAALENVLISSSLVLRSDPRTVEPAAAGRSTGKTNAASTIHAGMPRPAATTSMTGGAGGGGITFANILVAVVMIVAVVLVDYPDSPVHCAWAGEHDRGRVEGVVCYRWRRQERRGWWV